MYEFQFYVLYFFDNIFFFSLGGIWKYKDFLYVYSFCKFCYICQSSFDECNKICKGCEYVKGFCIFGCYLGWKGEYC